MASTSSTSQDAPPSERDAHRHGGAAGLARDAAQCLVLALAYLLFGALSRLLVPDSGFATPLWPAAGIALAALLCRGPRLWPGIVAGVVLVALYKPWQATGTLSWSGGALAISAAIGLGVAGQALLGAWLARRHARFDEGLLRGRDVTLFLLLGGPVSCLAGAAWAFSVLAAVNGASFELLAESARWWIGDTVGVLAVAPLAVVVLGRARVWRERLVTVALPILTCIVVALVAHDFVQRRENIRLQQEFETRAEALGDLFAHVVDTRAATVRSIASMMISVPSLTREEFRAFVTNRLRDLPGTQALGANLVVTDAEREALEQRVRGEGLPDYRIWQRGPDGKPVPAHGRDYYAPVYFTEPITGNERALGFDIASEPRRAQTLRTASEANDLRVTAPLRLVQESGSQAGVLAVMPVFDPVDSADGAGRRLRGYAVGVFRMGDLLEAAFGEHFGQPVTTVLTDITEPDEPAPMGSLHLDHRHRHGDILHPGERVEDADYRAERRFEVGGRTWALQFGAPEDFMSASWSWVPAAALGGGALLVSLLGGFLLSLTGRAMLDQRRALELADEVTERKNAERALGAEKERAEVTLHSIGDAVITTDANGQVDYMNPVAESMTGWMLAEARGLRLAQVFPIVNEFTNEPAADPVQRCLEEGRIIGLANHTVLISRSGRRYSIQDSAAPIRDRDRQLLGVVLVFNDVTESRRMAREAERAASLDPLTELINRREFEQRLENSLQSSQKYDARHALCYIDLDQFKVVNDTAGHRAGDVLLKDLAALLHSQLRERDTLARLGGDEFGLLLDNCPLDKGAEVAEKLIGAINAHRFEWEERSFRVGASIGVVPISRESRSSEELLANADVACYAAKDAGRNRVYVYDTESDAAHPRHVELLRAAELRSAIEADRLRLYVQPIVALAGDAPAATSFYEVLVRLADGDGTLLQPSAFIPAAERYGLMDAIDRWVVSRALARLGVLRRRDPGLRFALNLSGNSLNDERLLDFLEQSLLDSGVPGEAVCFEITETAAIHNLEQTARLIGAMKLHGCQFALDDFGAGLSSFGYLKRLPIDCLKIYGGLVREIASEASDLAMVRAVNQVAHDLGITTIAEWAEDDACVAVLRELGVDYGQGLALGHPRPVESLDAAHG